MIVLIATRLTVNERFTYTIGFAGRMPHFSTEDLSETADELRHLGVDDAIPKCGRGRCGGGIPRWR